MSSLLYKYNPDMKFPEAELRKNHTQFVDSSIFQQPPPPQPPQQQQQQSSGLTRYRSAPSSLLVELMNNNGGGNEDLPYRRTSSPEVETVLTSFISSCNEPELPEHQFEERPVKQETRDSVSKQSGSGGAGGGYSNSSHMMYQEAQQLLALDTSFNPINPPGLVGNRSNLIRQSSSPAGFFPNLSIDNGFNGMKEGAIYRAGNGTSGEAASPSSSRAHNQLNFSSGSSSYLHRMHQISENGNGNMGEGSQLQDHSNGNGGNSSHYNVSSSFPNDSWETSSFNDFKRARDNDGNKFSTSTALETHQNNDFGHRNHGLTHHMSLPNHFEIPAVEKFLQFEDSIPCKIRAKRGFATHPRSIAERMRRTRISERMKKLQDLFPDMDKQINTAEMLDLAVDYIKDLQKQVKTLRDTKAKCSCSSN